MNRSGRVGVLPLLVVTAVLLAGCSGGGSGTDRSTDAAGPSAATATAAPTTAAPVAEPSVAASPSTAAQIAEVVTTWYEFGGESAMVDLIGEIVTVQADRTPDELGYVTVDFGPLFDATEAARWPGTIPDTRTQTEWWTALGHLEDGAQAVLDSSPDVSLLWSRQETEQAYEGWRTFDKGVKELKAVQARLRGTFGLRPPTDPWKAPR
ncbi:hypothetical protein ACFY8O_04050 [Streptomyces argenteolus]|uniref:Uncharacterized protein n=1 Tax=Streptomyces argenteolus TaxID=67274 RepID=A0ABW6X1T2_9ACTN